MDLSAKDRVMSAESRTRSVWVFFLLVFVLAVPLYVIGALFGEAWAKLLPINLPLGALVFVTPLLAAAILVYREQGPVGVKDLLKRAFDYTRIKNKRWYVVALGLWPAVMLVEYGLMRLMGVLLPTFEFAAWLVPVFLVGFFVGGIFEELGWTAFATDRLQERYSALQTSLIIGVVWALVHVAADFQAPHAFTWILWQRLGTIVLRILMVWLYNNAGKSVFAILLFHTMVNVGQFMFPNYGSHYDPFLALLISAVLAVVVIILWTGQTLAHYRFQA